MSCAAVSPAERVVDEQYAAIERGDLEAWARGFAEDALLIGTDPGEVYVGRAAILEKVAKGASARMQADVKRTYRSARRHVGVAPDGKSAWVADEIDYRVTSPAKAQVFAFRMTSLIAERAGVWEILASCYSVAVPDQAAFAKEQPVPAAVPEVVGAGAEPLAEIVRRMEERPSRFAGSFSGRADVFLFGTAPEERVVGGAEVRRFTRQDEPEGKIRVARTGGIAAGISAAGRTGWIAYTAELRVPVEAGVVVLPVRVFAVLLEEDGSWQKVQEHVSLGVPN